MDQEQRQDDKDGREEVMQKLGMASVWIEKTKMSKGRGSTSGDEVHMNGGSRASASSADGLEGTSVTGAGRIT